jgi:hypothetical protein
MTLTYFIPRTNEAGLPCAPKEIPLPPIMLERPMIKIPRSASRQYSDSELSTAAAMMAKMRSRSDVIDHLRNQAPAVAFDADRTLDVVVEKLLDAI